MGIKIPKSPSPIWVMAREEKKNKNVYYSTIMEIKKKAEQEAKKTFTDKDFRIINTQDWLKEKFSDTQTPEVASLVYQKLEKKGTMKIGDKTISISTSKQEN